jgi:hypothetical protein
MKVTFKGRRPPLEDNIEILKLEYLRNHSSDLSQICNLSLGDQTKMDYCLKLRQPLMEDDLKISNVKYLSNH